MTLPVKDKKQQKFVSDHTKMATHMEKEEIPLKETEQNIRKEIEKLNDLKAKERNITIRLTEIEKGKSGVTSNVQVLMTNARQLYKECKEEYRNLGSNVKDIQDIQATETAKYGQQEWGKYDVLCITIQKLQDALAYANEENKSLRTQNNDLQQEDLTLRRDQCLSSIRESKAAMEAVGQILSSLKDMQDYVQLCEDLVWSENLDIR